MHFFRLLIVATLFALSGVSSADGSANPLGFLESHTGEWTVTGRMMGEDGWSPIAAQPATIEPLYDGRAYIEQSQIDFGGQVYGLTTLFSWDPFREIYRVAALDEGYGLLDIYEGVIDDDGRLTVTNLRSDTSFPAGPDGEMHFMLRWTFASEAAFFFEVLLSTDRGENWSPYFELDYERATAE